jgi:hypothetical protein
VQGYSLEVLREALVTEREQNCLYVLRVTHSVFQFQLQVRRKIALYNLNHNATRYVVHLKCTLRKLEQIFSVTDTSPLGPVALCKIPFKEYLFTWPMRTKFFEVNLGGKLIQDEDLEMFPYWLTVPKAKFPGDDGDSSGQARREGA